MGFVCVDAVSNRPCNLKARGNGIRGYTTEVRGGGLWKIKGLKLKIICKQGFIV